MADPIEGSPRVYVKLRRGDVTTPKVLDFAYVDGLPAAILSWAVTNGKQTPGVYRLLDPILLRSSVATAMWWYYGVLELAG